jgi:hypothetical protein
MFLRCFDKLNFAYLTIFVLLSCSSLSYGAIGDRWDVGLDFSASSNPNGPWSYRAWPDLGLMVADSGQHGFGPGWKNPAATYQTIAQGSYLLSNEVGGHSHAGLRWTSPVDGWVKLSGYLFMGDSSDPTRVHWFILKQNGQEFSRGSVKLNPDGTAVVGRAGTVNLEEGNGGAAALTRRVHVGDTMDMGIENINGPGHFYGAKLVIEQVDYSWPVWPVCGDAAHPFPSGDVNQDCRVDIQDLVDLARNWLSDVNP